MNRSLCCLPVAGIMLLSLRLHAQPPGEVWWRFTSPNPQGNTLRSLGGYDAINFFAVGDHGTFVRSTNGGATWTAHHNIGGYKDTLRDVFFVSPVMCNCPFPVEAENI